MDDDEQLRDIVGDAFDLQTRALMHDQQRPQVRLDAVKTGIVHT